MKEGNILQIHWTNNKLIILKEMLLKFTEEKNKRLRYETAVTKKVAPNKSMKIYPSVNHAMPIKCSFQML